MKPILENLDLIDLISERHLLLRKITEKTWNDRSDISISNSEWFIMARIYRIRPTLAQVSKSVDISRQATHKIVRGLESRGLVIIEDSTENNKDKCISMTTLGEECYEKNLALKAELIDNIADHIGRDKVTHLKEILMADWGI
ncbi:MarR family transcriptional regulator [Youngiibacter multivorans]|uniref:DNA-binding MarR family transcriptional regulator n=1 Tax=Youngiibacter multivorans TaxID=937251 RepID=A0ABS4G437_9CLOT|nr:MarR family transcriptional regulator [Youngiibacter multivorans]MBP1919314.1 DNA-binding MarR family transcriptional regulator [Youngiibacter multivorans]